MSPEVIEEQRVQVARLTPALAATAYFSRTAGLRYANIAVSLSAQSGEVWKPAEVEVALVEWVRRNGEPRERRFLDGGTHA